MTYKQIMVGLDQSWRDSAVFARALELSRPHSTSMTIVHTLQSDQSRSPVTVPDGQHTTDARDMYNIMSRQHQARRAEDKRRAQGWLDMYFQQAIAKGIPAQVHCEVGNPGLWICEIAQRGNADLIVIGQREHHDGFAIGDSNVTQYVLQHAPCSVLIVQGATRTNPMNRLDRTSPKTAVHTPAERRLANQMFKV